MMKIILTAACIVLAGAFILQEKQEHYVPAVILKGAASLCFVLLGVLNAPKGNPMATKIVIGLLLGMIADVLLNLRFVVKNGKPVFLVGILVFLAGHIMYLLAVFPMVQSKWIVVIAAVVLTALLMKWIFSKITAEKAFKIFGIVYIGAIVLLNCAAIFNLITAPGAFTTVFAIGAILFLISDIVLILNTFGPKSEFRLRVTNLSLYYAGQILIAFSLFLL